MFDQHSGLCLVEWILSCWVIVLSAGCAENVKVNFWSPESACVAVMFVWTFSSNSFIFLRGQALFHLIYTVKMCCIFSRCVSTGWKPFFILQAAIQSTNDRVQYNDLQSLLCATLQVSVKHLMYMTSFWAEWKRKGLYHLGCWFRYWFSFECLHYFLKWCEVFHQWDLRSIIFSERCPQDDTRGCTKDIWPDHDSIAEHVPKHQWKIGQCTRGCFSRCVNTVWRWVLPCVM